METLVILVAILGFIGVVYGIFWWLYIRPMKNEQKRHTMTRDESIACGIGSFVCDLAG